MHRQEEEEWSPRVAPLQEADPLAEHPGRGMQRFGFVPWAGRDAVAVDPVVKIIRLGASALPQPRQVVINVRRVLMIVPQEVNEAVVQLDAFEPQPLTGWVDMHLADRLGLIAVSQELSGHGDGVVPFDVLAIADTTVMFRGQARVQGCPCRDTRWHPRIRAQESRSAAGEIVEIRSLD